MDIDALLREIDTLEERVWASLSKTSAQIALYNKDRDLTYHKKLESLDLTTHEWEIYQTRFRKKETSLDPGLRRDDGVLDDAVAAERFYDLAEKRDRILAKNYLAARSPNQLGLVVAGGFHTEGILKELQAHGLPVLLVAPKLTDIESAEGEDYLSIFTRDRHALDNLFVSKEVTIIETSRLKNPGLRPHHPIFQNHHGHHPTGFGSIS